MGFVEVEVTELASVPGGSTCGLIRVWSRVGSAQAGKDEQLSMKVRHQDCGGVMRNKIH